jgi:hypothetical protein
LRWFLEYHIGVEDQLSGTPEVYSLGQNYPNPFNPTTIIRYQISHIGYLKLAVYDLLGREVAVLVDGIKAAGTYTVEFDAHNLPSGTYFCRMQVGSYVETKKLLLLK